VTGSRILVAQPLMARLLPLLAERVAACRTGAPLDPATQLGPLANDAQAARVRHYLAQGTSGSAAACLMASGQAAAGPRHVAPALFTGADATSPLMQDEIFGPVAGVLSFADEPELLAMANGSRYGLSATLWTRDVARAHRLVRQLHAGHAVVNAVAKPRPGFAMLAGGEPVGLSGYGVEGGVGGLLAYTRQRSVTFNLG
jgi:acyl-CoA reductase-like NAD-dependent aldehyde dehydrogenase